MTPLHSDLSGNEPLQTWLERLGMQVSTCSRLRSPREFHLRPVGHPFVDTFNKGMWLTSTQESVNLPTVVMWHSNHFQPWLTDFHHGAAYRIEPEATMNKEKRSSIGPFCVSCLDWMKQLAVTMGKCPDDAVWACLLLLVRGSCVVPAKGLKSEACTLEW